MITAAKAKVEAQKKIKDGMTKELAKVESQINEAISSGKLCFSEDGTLLPETKEQLEKYGYKVQTGSQYNESYYIVDWS